MYFVHKLMANSVFLSISPPHSNISSKTNQFGKENKYVFKEVNLESVLFSPSGNQTRCSYFFFWNENKLKFTLFVIPFFINLYEIVLMWYKDLLDQHITPTPSGIYSCKSIEKKARRLCYFFLKEMLLWIKLILCKQWCRL